MRRFLQALTISCILMLAVLPGVFFKLGLFNPQNFDLLIVLNFFGWILLSIFWGARENVRKSALQVAHNLMIYPQKTSLEALLSELFAEVERKNNAFMVNLIENNISSSEELAKGLQRIVAQTYKLLKAESAELALFDKESGLYHSSFVVGKPFRQGAQAMLTDVIRSEDSELSPHVIVMPLAFGGSILGTLRAALSEKRIPTPNERDILKILAIQGAVAIINSQFTDELMRMKSHSDESLKAKTGFLANLSHEIRGPLGIIMNATELVLEGLCGEINQDQASTLGMIKNNSTHLLELINDVLDYDKIESGKLVCEPTEILVADILTDIAAVVRKQAESKGHKILTKTSAEALALSCDRRHLRQMLINLLTNAIKYTPDQGTIELSAERVPGNKIKINVKDTGVGIAAEDRAKVFAAFERIDHTYSINQTGSGLGMPLTQKLAEANGGTIDFSSEIGKGSLFWITLPAVEYSPISKSPEKDEKRSIRGLGEQILILERDQGEREMIQRYLEHLGFNARACSSLAEAQSEIQKSKIDLAILDNLSLDQPGDDSLRQISKSLGGGTVPLLLVSSRAFAFDIERYLRAGIDRCLSKPLPLNQLGEICRSLIDQYRKIEQKANWLTKEQSIEQKQTAMPAKNVARETLH